MNTQHSQNQNKTLKQLLKELPDHPVVRITRFHCQGTGVQFLVGELRSYKLGFLGGSVVRTLPANAGDMGSIWEDPTCRGAAKPLCHISGACALEQGSHNY